MRKLVMIFTVVVAASPAHAAWFCGDEPANFAKARAGQALASVSVEPYEIIRGPIAYSQTTIFCDQNNSCSMVPADNASADQPDWTSRVDAYQAKVSALDDWSATLADGCLRDAYHAVAVSHRSVIEIDRRAIEFMKSPAPLSPVS